MKCLGVVAWICVAVLVGGLGINLASADQSNPQATATVAVYQTTIAEQNATIAAQATKIAELETKSTAESPSATAKPRKRKPPKSDPIPLTDSTELLYYYFATSHQGNVALFGEIHNLTDADIVSPYVRFTLLDGEGNIVSTVDAKPLLPYIAANKTVPISATYLNVTSDEWETEQITGCGDVYTDNVPPGLSIEGVTEVSKDADRLEVKGKVRNGGDTPVSGIEVLVLMYRKDGRFGGSGLSLIQSAIPPGKTARFDVSAYGSDIAGITEDDDDYTYDVVPTLNNASMYSC